MNAFKHNSEENYIEIIQRLVKCVVVLLVIIVVLLAFLVMAVPSSKKDQSLKKTEVSVSPGKKSSAELSQAADNSCFKNKKQKAHRSSHIQLTRIFAKLS